MNDKRRKQIRNINEQLNDCREVLEDVVNDEEKYLYNMPENLHGSERYEASEGFIDVMNDALSNIESAIDSLEEIN